MNGINHKEGVTFRRRFIQGGMFGLFKLSAAINGAALLIVVYFLVAKGMACHQLDVSQPAAH